ncbi:MAG TPA: DNA gyrase subunit B, partial [Alphaproteobacteria bacterium]
AVLAEPERASAAADYIARRLDLLAKPEERGWTGRVSADGGLAFTRTLSGVTDRHGIDLALIKSGEAHRLDAMAAELQTTYAKHARLRSGETEIVVTGPVSLIDSVMELGRKGVAVSRYKGLGEMNPEQLWETTLDPNARSLLQVRVSHADEAEEVFSTLMGDLVEPRRDFIQSNALSVANLDV